VIFVSTNPEEIMKSKFCLLLMLLLGTCLNAGISPEIKKQNSNYVVIGAFAYQDNAAHFTEKAKKEKFDARFEINKNRKLFYVYVLHTDDVKLAFSQAQDLRARTSFSDTWVFQGILGEEATGGSDIHPETKKHLNQVDIEDKSPSTGEIKSIVDDGQKVESIPGEINVTAALPSKEEGKEGHTFFFKIVKASNQKELSGDVDVFDQDKNKKSASYVGNQDVFIRPVNQSGHMLFKCEVFGYRKIEKGINFNDLQSNEGILVEGNKATIPFELVRLKRGDIAVMYNVLFFKDAAIMRPESRIEVTSLLEMMKENPKMKVRIHGHTNGGAAGKIIEIGESKNYFSLSGTREGFGTAKKLSEERAELIKSFLVSEGIEPIRMEVKAWGGKRPIYEKDHSLAHSNVRVEIEIIED
jgi:outer membrane protein OmpA-like peptidoglycan-associated protein